MRRGGSKVALGRIIKQGKLWQQHYRREKKTWSNFHHGITFILGVAPAALLILCCRKKKLTTLNVPEKKFEIQERCLSFTAANTELKKLLHTSLSVHCTCVRKPDLV